MKDVSKHFSVGSGGHLSFALSQSSGSSQSAHRQLAGFAKVLAGGRVVGINHDKRFADRMIHDGVTRSRSTDGPVDRPVEQVILESVATNLEAGLKLLDKQELSLAQIGGKLSEMALCLNQVRRQPQHAESAQARFEETRNRFRALTRETFDHTAVFSMGPAQPISVTVPSRMHWEELRIDRCNLKQPGLQSIEAGKVSPDAEGLLLDPESFKRAFSEWRALCASNRLQWFCLSDRLRGILRTLKHFLGGRRWAPPPFPDDPDGSPLRSPHSGN